MHPMKRAIVKKLGIVKSKPVSSGLGGAVASRTCGSEYQGTLKAELARRKRDRCAQQSS